MSSSWDWFLIASFIFRAPDCIQNDGSRPPSPAILPDTVLGVTVTENELRCGRMSSCSGQRLFYCLFRQYMHIQVEVTGKGSGHRFLAGEDRPGTVCGFKEFTQSLSLFLVTPLLHTMCVPQLTPFCVDPSQKQNTVKCLPIIGYFYFDRTKIKHLRPGTLTPATPGNSPAPYPINYSHLQLLVIPLPHTEQPRMHITGSF